MDETRNDAPLTGEAPQPAKPQPLRRVGSFTLGVCLIAAGIFFLLAYFVPGVDWKLMLKIAPAAGLILLGGEVLFFAARPGRWKYDFWSVRICLGLMGGCFCLSLLPVVWDELGPERNQASMKLGQEYTTEAYDKIKQTAPDVRVKNISGNAYLYSSEAKTLRDVNAGNGYLSLTVELFGSYDSVQAFAQDCRSVTDAVQQCSAQPDELRITWSPENDPGQSLASGSLQNVEQYTLELDGTGLLLTGSNMSGKTTFIRTVMLNALLGETLCTCFAERFTAPYMRLHSSIRISDDITEGTSYYLQEVLTVKRLLEDADRPAACLFVLDELFKGTNTTERIAAGKAVLARLNRGPHIVLAATHDIELAELLRGDGYELHHFREEVADGRLVFDYCLHTGPLTTRNAIRILELYDYPPELIAEAYDTQQKLLGNG